MKEDELMINPTVLKILTELAVPIAVEAVRSIVKVIADKGRGTV